MPKLKTKIKIKPLKKKKKIINLMNMITQNLKKYVSK